MTGGDCFCLKGRKKSHLVCPSHEQHGVSLLCRNDANAATNQKTRPKQGRSVCHRDRTCGCSCPVSTGHHRAPTDSVTGRVAEVGGVPARKIWGHSGDGGLDSRGGGPGEPQTREKGGSVHVFNLSCTRDRRPHCNRWPQSPNRTPAHLPFSLCSGRLPVWVIKYSCKEKRSATGISLQDSFFLSCISHG